LKTLSVTICFYFLKISFSNQTIIHLTLQEQIFLKIQVDFNHTGFIKIT